ncbi:hypothetical protein [Leuconostoc falkenbergense]|jgi:hypothetical protein
MKKYNLAYIINGRYIKKYDLTLIQAIILTFDLKIKGIQYETESVENS